MDQKVAKESLPAVEPVHSNWRAERLVPVEIYGCSALLRLLRAADHDCSGRASLRDTQCRASCPPPLRGLNAKTFRCSIPLTAVLAGSLLRNIALAKRLCIGAATLEPLISRFYY